MASSSGVWLSAVPNRIGRVAACVENGLGDLRSAPNNRFEQTRSRRRTLKAHGAQLKRSTFDIQQRHKGKL